MSDDIPQQPRCPICDSAMQPDHVRPPPTMGSSGVRYIAWRWMCNQSDGIGNGHSLTIYQKKVTP